MMQARWTGTLIAAVSLFGCGGSEQKTLSWNEFKEQAFLEPETGVFIVNGDELAETESDLRAVYARYADQQRRLAEGAPDQGEQELIVNLVNGRDDKWASTQKNNLTYCVSQSSFGSRYPAVVNAMASAGSAWHGTANITFVHASGSDSSCSRSSSTVFNVRQVSTHQYLARSFFPSSSRSAREVLISSDSFGNISPWTLTGILRHELGHTLGFRHEHTRPEAGVCFEDNDWRALTAYDSASVMHYPQCNGTNRGDLVLTSLDRSGAKKLYP